MNNSMVLTNHNTDNIIYMTEIIKPKENPKKKPKLNKDGTISKRYSLLKPKKKLML